MELARNDAAYDGRETGSGGKHFHAFSCIFMHFHVFSCMCNEEHAISEDFKHFHAF